jgi:hypothetical protein
VTGAIDFDGINAAALRQARSLLPVLIPGGTFRSLEYVARNPRRNDASPGSFKINYKTGKWSDFATNDKGGDLISLLAYLRGASQGDAARELAEKLGVPLFKPNGFAANGRGYAEPKIAPATDEPRVYQWGDDGPPKQVDEVRRHVYRSSACPVRIKIKLSSGEYVQWYRAFGADSGPIGWQKRKPADYHAIPYITQNIDPFDPELVADEIFWPEGEKDVENLDKINAPAFTFGGTGDGLPDRIDHYLKDRRIVILADNDDPGRAHAEKKAAVTHAAGAASIKIVSFPELLLPDKDVSDFIKLGGRLEQIMARSEAASIWSPPTILQDVSEQSRRHGWRSRIVKANELQAMTFPPVRHIVRGYISEGATIIAGKPKIGKSWLTLDIGLGATADRFTLGTIKPAQGDVLYLALEDNNRRLKRRMAKLWPAREAQWPERLNLVTDWRRADEGGLEDIDDWCRADAVDPVMVIIDTLEKFRPIQKGNSAAYSADYAAVTGLQKLASKHRIAVVINHHVRKMDADDPFDTVSGTLGLTGAADTIIVLKRHAGAVTLHARGRDIEEVETALQFDKATCRWTILGAAAEVYISGERAAVLKALAGAGAEGLAVSEIMAATGSNSRGAMDTLLFKMKENGEIDRVKRGVYALRQDSGKIGEKERNDTQVAENTTLTDDLSNLSDLTGLSGSGEERHRTALSPEASQEAVDHVSVHSGGS